MEKRILFRLLSGLHSSIMTQIANLYRFDGEEGKGEGKGRREALFFSAGTDVPHCGVFSFCPAWPGSFCIIYIRFSIFKFESAVKTIEPVF